MLLHLKSAWPMSASIPINLSATEKALLKKIQRSGNHRSDCGSSEIVVLAAAGHPNYEIAERIGIDVNKVGRWRNRYARDGFPGIEKDRPRRAIHGGNVEVEQAKLPSLIIKRTTTEKPEGAIHWSTRGLPAVLNTSHQFFATVWREAGLRPHLHRQFKVSNDPLFEEKLHDIVVLYLNPPEQAIVFCVDEKSSIQALYRTLPGLPMKPESCQTMTHDYKRHRTSTLFAALDVATGKVIGQCKPRHRHQEFLAFLKTVEKEATASHELHLIVDNNATHKHKKVKNWPKRNKRVHLHFIPST